MRKIVQAPENNPFSILTERTQSIISKPPYIMGKFVLPAFSLPRLFAERGCVSRCFPTAQPGKPLGFQGQRRVREVGQGGRPERAAGARARRAAALKVFFTPRSDSCTYLWGEPCRSHHEEKRKICQGWGETNPYGTAASLLKRQQETRANHVAA